MKSWRRRFTGSVWTLADQALSSVTNFALALLLARQLPSRQVADTGLLLGAVALVLVVQRALIVEPTFLDFGPGRPEVQRAAIKEARRASLYVAAIAAALFLASAPLVTRPTRIAALLLAASSPVLLSQDLGRYSSFLLGKPTIAVASDAVWVVVMGALGGGAWALGLTATPTTLFAIWLLGASAAACVVLWCLHAGNQGAAYTGGVRLRPRWRLLAESLLTLVPTYGVPLVVVAAGGLAEAGTLRSGQVLVSPLSPLVTAVGTVALVRATTRSMVYRRVQRLAAVVAALLIVTFAVYAAALLSAPGVAHSVFGAAHTRGRSLLPWLVMYGALAAAATGPRTALRALRRVDRSFLAEAVSCVATLTVCVPLVMLGGAHGAAVGLAVGAALGLVGWIAIARRAAHGSFETASDVAPEATVLAATAEPDRP